MSVEKWMYDAQRRQEQHDECQHTINHGENPEVSEDHVNLCLDHQNLLEEFGRLLERHRKLAAKVHVVEKCKATVKSKREKTPTSGDTFRCD